MTQCRHDGIVIRREFPGLAEDDHPQRSNAPVAAQLPSGLVTSRRLSF
jgi:hypothetical protein